jgi:hypothetical protein
MRWLDRVFWTDSATGGYRPLTAPGETAETIAPLDTTIRSILDAVVALHGGSVGYVDADLDAAIFQHQTSAEKRHDTKCSDALQRALSYAPTASFWWDYTTSPATIRFEDSAKLSADKTLSETAYELLSGSIDPQYELMADSVKIYWLKDNALVREDTASGSSQAATLGANRPQIITLEVGNYIVPEEGLAAAVHKFYSRLHVNSTAVMASLDWTHRPGQLWAYGGIFAGSWTAFCHQITRDLFTGNQTLNLGVPPAFGIVKLSDSASAPSSSSSEPGTVSITRTIEDPNSDALEGDSFFIINGVATKSGESIDLPSGSYVIVYLVPEKYIAPGQETAPPTYEELVVEENTPGTAVLTTGTATDTVTATWRSRLQLRRADGQTGEDVDLNVGDIPAEKGTAKLREISWIAPDLTIYKAMVLCTAPEVDGTAELPEGPAGPAGSPGAPGTDGADGREPTGATATCAGDGTITIELTYPA